MSASHTDSGKHLLRAKDHTDGFVKKHVPLEHRTRIQEEFHRHLDNAHKEKPSLFNENSDQAGAVEIALPRFIHAADQRLSHAVGDLHGHLKSDNRFVALSKCLRSESHRRPDGVLYDLAHLTNALSSRKQGLEAALASESLERNRLCNEVNGDIKDIDIPGWDQHIDDVKKLGSDDLIKEAEAIRSNLGNAGRLLYSKHLMKPGLARDKLREAHKTAKKHLARVGEGREEHQTAVNSHAEACSLVSTDLGYAAAMVEDLQSKHPSLAETYDNRHSKISEHVRKLQENSTHSTLSSRLAVAALLPACMRAEAILAADALGAVAENLVKLGLRVHFAQDPSRYKHLAPLEGTPRILDLRKLAVTGAIPILTANLEHFYHTYKYDSMYRLESRALDYEVETDFLRKAWLRTFRRKVDDLLDFLETEHWDRIQEKEGTLTEYDKSIVKEASDLWKYHGTEGVSKALELARKSIRQLSKGSEASVEDEGDVIDALSLVLGGIGNNMQALGNEYRKEHKQHQSDVKAAKSLLSSFDWLPENAQERPRLESKLDTIWQKIHPQDKYFREWVQVEEEPLE